MQFFPTPPPPLFLACRIPATLSSATTEVGSSILAASPVWLPRPALLLSVTWLNSLVSLCEPGPGWLSCFTACDLRAVTTACSGKARRRSSKRLVGGGGGGWSREGGGWRRGGWRRGGWRRVGWRRGGWKRGGGEDPIPLGARYPSGSCLGQ